MAADTKDLVRLSLVRLRSGQLPRSTPDQEFGGLGSDTACDLCGEPITPREIAIEAVYSDAGELFFHPACMNAVRIACREAGGERLPNTPLAR